VLQWAAYELSSVTCTATYLASCPKLHSTLLPSSTVSELRNFINILPQCMKHTFNIVHMLHTAIWGKNKTSTPKICERRTKSTIPSSEKLHHILDIWQISINWVSAQDLCGTSRTIIQRRHACYLHNHRNKHQCGTAAIAPFNKKQPRPYQIIKPFQFLLFTSHDNNQLHHLARWFGNL
jgi:hypothetical protein